MIVPASLLLLSVLQGGPMDVGAESTGRPEGIRASADDRAIGLARLRSLYLLSVEDESAIEVGLLEVERLRGKAAGRGDARLRGTLEAYRGALLTLRAKHALWPTARLRHLREGLEVLDAAVAAHPEVAEVRYLRLMSCYFLPAVLGRKASVREDFAQLARLLPGQRAEYPEEAYRAIVAFVLREGSLGPRERAPLERLMEADDG